MVYGVILWYVHNRACYYTTCFVLCTRLTIWILDQYKRNQDAIHFSCIQMVWLFDIQMLFKYPTIGIQPLFNHLNTELVWLLDLIYVKWNNAAIEM